MSCSAKRVALTSRAAVASPTPRPAGPPPAMRPARSGWPRETAIGRPSALRSAPAAARGRRSAASARARPVPAGRRARRLSPRSASGRPAGARPSGILVMAADAVHRDIRVGGQNGAAGQQADRRERGQRRDRSGRTASASMAAVRTSNATPSPVYARRSPSRCLHSGSTSMTATTPLLLGCRPAGLQAGERYQAARARPAHDNGQAARQARLARSRRRNPVRPPRCLAPRRLRVIFPSSPVAAIFLLRPWAPSPRLTCGRAGALSLNWSSLLGSSMFVASPAPVVPVRDRPGPQGRPGPGRQPPARRRAAPVPREVPPAQPGHANRE